MTNDDVKLTDKNKIQRLLTGFSLRCLAGGIWEASACVCLRGAGEARASERQSREAASLLLCVTSPNNGCEVRLRNRE